MDRKGQQQNQPTCSRTQGIVSKPSIVSNLSRVSILSLPPSDNESIDATSKIWDTQSDAERDNSQFLDSFNDDVTPRGVPVQRLHASSPGGTGIAAARRWNSRSVSPLGPGGTPRADPRSHHQVGYRPPPPRRTASSIPRSDVAKLGTSSPQFRPWGEAPDAEQKTSRASSTGSSAHSSDSGQLPLLKYIGERGSVLTQGKVTRLWGYFEEAIQREGGSGGAVTPHVLPTSRLAPTTHRGSLVQPPTIRSTQSSTPRVVRSPSARSWGAAAVTKQLPLPREV